MWRGACTRGQLIGPTRVNQPLEQTQQAPRNYNLSQARIQFSVSNSACPRGRGRDSHTDARTHSQIRSHTHARRYTRATCTFTWTHTCCPYPRPPGAPLGWRGGQQTPVFCPQQAPVCLLAPTKPLFFVAENFLAPCVYLFSKFSPVTKSNLKQWNNQ